MRTILKRLFRDTRGATAIEYGLILSLIVIAIIAGISSLGSSTRGAWGNIANKVSAVTPNT